MKQSNTKQRLFEIMGKVDHNFKSKLNEMPNWGKTRANPAYTHFAVIKGTGKIVNGWDYKGYDQDELRQNNKEYFLNDIKDMEINPKLVNILTAKYLQSKGIDPFSYSNWLSNEEFSNYRTM